MNHLRAGAFIALAFFHLQAVAGTPNEQWCATFGPSGLTETHWYAVISGASNTTLSTLDECKNYVADNQQIYGSNRTILTDQTACDSSSTADQCNVRVYADYGDDGIADSSSVAGRCEAVCVEPSCTAGELHTFGRTSTPGASGSVVHPSTGSVGGCEIQQVGDAGCGGQTLEQIYASMPAPYRSSSTGKLHYGVAFCTTGASTEDDPIDDPSPPPAADQQAGDMEAPYEDVQPPSSGADQSPVQSETNGDGSVTDTQTETEWEDHGSGESLDYAEGTVSVVEFASYDDGRIDVETVTETTTYPDGTVVETVTTTTTERGAQTVQSTISSTGVTEVVQGDGEEVVTTTTTTTTTNPDGSSTSTTTTSGGGSGGGGSGDDPASSSGDLSDTDGDGIGGCLQDADDCAPWSGGEGQGAFDEDGLDADIEAAKAELETVLGNIKTEATALWGSWSRGGSGELPSETASTSYGDIEIGVGTWESWLSYLKQFIHAVALIIAFLIVLNALTYKRGD